MKRTLLNSTAALVLAASPALAQQKDAQPGAQTQQQVQNQNQHKLTAAEFVRRAAIGDLFELRLSQLATSSANNDAVGEFARTLVKDYWQDNQDLREAAGDISIPTELDQRHANMIERLQKAPKGNFDRQFIRMQIRAHRQAISLYRKWIAQNDTGSGQTATGQAAQANQDLLEFAEATLPTLQEHLRSAQELRSELRQGSGIASRQNRSNVPNQWSDNAQERRSYRDSLAIQQQPPEVTIRRQSPQVSVRQPQPQITVRQAPPTVTIQQPPPEVIVRMPRPDVNVESSRPQVSVNVPRPQVRFQESDVEPRVRIQQQDAEGRQVEFQRGQPQVNYERTGEPKVVYQKSDSQPRVRYQSQAQSGSDSQRSRNQTERTAKQSEKDWTSEARRLTEDKVGRDAATTGSREVAVAANQLLRSDRSSASSIKNVFVSS